jgi:hypothetical protein
VAGFSNQHAIVFYSLPIIVYVLCLDAASHQVLVRPHVFAQLVAAVFVGLAPYGTRQRSALWGPEAHFIWPYFFSNVYGFLYGTQETLVRARRQRLAYASRFSHILLELNLKLSFNHWLFQINVTATHLAHASQRINGLMAAHTVLTLR